MSYALILNCNCLLCHANVLFMSIHLSIDMWTSGLNSFRKAPSNPRVCVPYWSEPAMILAVELFPFSGQICELCAILLYLYPNTYLFTCAVDVYLLVSRWNFALLLLWRFFSSILAVKMYSVLLKSLLLYIILWIQSNKLLEMVSYFFPLLWFCFLSFRTSTGCDEQIKTDKDR